MFLPCFGVLPYVSKNPFPNGKASAQTCQKHAKNLGFLIYFTNGPLHCSTPGKWHVFGMFLPCFGILPYVSKNPFPNGKASAQTCQKPRVFLYILPMGPYIVPPLESGMFLEYVRHVFMFFRAIGKTCQKHATKHAKNTGFFQISMFLEHICFPPHKSHVWEACSSVSTPRSVRVGMFSHSENQNGIDIDFTF